MIQISIDMTNTNSNLDLNQTISLSVESNNLEGSSIIVGVSGGPDSIALLHSLNSIKQKYNLSIFGGHLNHGIRPIDADNDQQFVEKIFKKMGIPFLSKKVDLKNDNKHQFTSIENIARIERHNFLFDAASHFNANFVALGHHLDDQAETIMLHIIRGSGLDGIKGMSEISKRKINDKEINIFRPFLTISHQNILKYLAAQNINFQTDISNYSTKYRRNSIRHFLFPKLETYNPEIKKSLYRLSESVKNDLNFLEEFSINEFNSISEVNQSQITLQINKLLELPDSILFRVIKHSFSLLTDHQQDIEMIHIKMVVNLIKGETGKKIQLPKSLTVSKQYNHLIMSTVDKPVYLLPKIDQLFSVNVPGTTFIDKWKITTTAQKNKLIHDNTQNNDDLVKYISKQNHLYVRKRKKGDKFVPSGMTHHKKIQDFMVDEKIPQQYRDRIPLLVNEKDEILWVVGWRTSETSKLNHHQEGLKINFQLLSI